MAKSLLDGINTSGPSRSKGSGDGSNKVKLIAAIGLLVVALGVLGWYYGFRDTAPEIPMPTPEEVQAAEQQQQQIIEDAKARGATFQGGS